MRNVLLVFILSALVVAGFSGCSIIPEKQYLLEEEITLDDGAVYPVGTPVWADEEGNPTFEDTGVPYMEPDVEKVEALADSAEKGANTLPWFGGLIGLVVGIAGSAAVAGLRKKREADRKAAKDRLKGA